MENTMDEQSNIKLVQTVQNQEDDESSSNEKQNLAQQETAQIEAETTHLTIDPNTISQGYVDVGSDTDSDIDNYDDDDDNEDADDAGSEVELSEDEEMVNEAKELGVPNFMRKYILELKWPASQILRSFGVHVPEEYVSDDMTLINALKIVLSRRVRKRSKLPQYNSIEDALELIKKAKNIMVLTGAGVSVSCGVPDFRSANGLYATLSQRFPEMEDPQEMFDIRMFREKPECFYSFAREIYPSNFIPSPSHYFIKLLEDREQLLRNYTQNIDTIEGLAGIQKFLPCHGSFAKASCIECGHTVSGDAIREEIFAEKVPLCPICPDKIQRAPKRGVDSEDDDGDDNPYKDKAVMKPTITFFGEKLSDDFENSLTADREKVDLLIVMGTSLKVAPVSEIIGHIPHSVPQILINRDPVTHFDFDICLLGNSDDVISYLTNKLEWPLQRQTSNLAEPTQVGDSHVWLFNGANSTHRWVRQFENEENAEQQPTISGVTTPLKRPREENEEEKEKPEEYNIREEKRNNIEVVNQQERKQEEEKEKVEETVVTTIEDNSNTSSIQVQDSSNTSTSIEITTSDSK